MFYVLAIGGKVPVIESCCLDDNLEQLELHRTPRAEVVSYTTNNRPLRRPTAGIAPPQRHYPSFVRIRTSPVVSTVALIDSMTSVTPINVMSSSKMRIAFESITIL